MDEVQSVVKALKKSTHKAFRKLHLRSLRPDGSEQKHDESLVHREISFNQYVVDDETKKIMKEERPKVVRRSQDILPPGTPLEKKDIIAALPVYFPEESTVVLCRVDGTPCMHQNYATSGEEAVAELSKIIDMVNVEDRDRAIRDGLLFMGKRFEVFQFHPPLVYGRTAGVAAKESVGIVVVRHALNETRECPLLDDSCKGQKECYLIVTYSLPETSAHILYLARSFCSKFL